MPLFHFQIYSVCNQGDWKGILKMPILNTVDVIIPVYRPDDKLNKLLDMLKRQTVQIHKLIIIDSDEKSFEQFFSINQIWDDERFVLKHIPNQQFDHGNTRKMAMDLSDSEFAICMTQDAVPESEKLIEELLRPFQDESVAASYARQLPNSDCREMEKFTRAFNYPSTAKVKSIVDLQELGIKTFFCSNVCACYRKSIYEKLGGFVEKTIFNEDMILAGNAVKAGYKIAYAADARVYHSHNYSAMEQFHRNFDLGVSQAEHPEIFEGIKSESEGIKMVKLSIAHLCKTHHYLQIIQLIFHSAAKLFGYKLGKKYSKLPHGFVVACSMNKNYWK